MATIKSLNKWANRHSYYYVDALRVALGIFLFSKALSFMTHSEALINVIGPLQNLSGGVLFLHYMVPAHIVGGLLITFGLLTRWAVVAQLPLLFGALIVNCIGEINTLELLEASIAFLLCLFFLYFGSGKNSADYYLKMQQ